MTPSCSSSASADSQAPQGHPGTPGPGTARPGRSSRPRSPSLARAPRWPTTQPPPNSSSSAAPSQAPESRGYLDLGRHHLDPASPRARQPSGRRGSMAYDPATSQLVLFGGVGQDGRTPGPGTAPPGPSSHRRQAHLSQLGPWPMTRPPPSSSFRRHWQRPVPGDTWIWDGTNWTQQPPASPSFRDTPPWPMTRPPPSSYSSAGIPRVRRRMTPGPGTAPPGPSRHPR